MKAEIICCKINYRLDGIRKINFSIHYDKSESYYKQTDLINLDADLSIGASNFEVMNLTFREQVDIIFYLKKR